MLPCEIEYTGPAIVSAYFKPESAKRGLESTFRGRALRGVQLEPPAGYSGALLQDTVQATVADGEERRWLHKGAIASFTVWKHDELPHDDEPIFKCMRIAALANALHGDADESDANATGPNEASPIAKSESPIAKTESPA